MIILPHVSYQHLQNIVRYAYTGQLQLPHHTVDDFMTIALDLQLAGVHVDKDDSNIPQDLSMKHPNKRIKLEESPSPSPAHDTKPETFLRKTLLTFPATAQSLPNVSSSNTSSNQHMTKPRPAAANIPDKHLQNGSKLPNWSQSQLQDAIESVITQKLRFTQASAKYGIPKGTLYDNILGKSKRMQVLDQVGLTDSQEVSVLEFCCEISSMPYNRRTSRSLTDIIQFIENMKHKEGNADFNISMRQGFKWWWAFTKKHNIISLYYQEGEESKQIKSPNSANAKTKDDSRHVPSPENLLNLINSPSSIPINIPTSNFLPFFGLNNHSKYSMQHPDFLIPSNSAPTNIV